MQVLSHRHPNFNILIYLHLCTLPPPSRSEVSCLICIHVMSHLNSSHDICITAPFTSYLIPIQVSILSPELHPDHVSPPSGTQDLHSVSIQVTPQPHPVASQFLPGPISTPPRSPDVRFTSIHVPSHLHSVSYSCISPPSTSRLTSIQVLIFASHVHVGGETCSSSASMFYLTPIQVLRCASHLHPYLVAPPTRSVDSHLTPIQVTSNLHPGKFSLQDLFLWCCR